MSASTTKTKNQPSRKPVLLDYLKAFTKDKLIFAARQLCITYSKLKNHQLAEKICTKIFRPSKQPWRKNASILPTVNMHCCCPLFLWATLFPIQMTALKQ